MSTTDETEFVNVESPSLLRFLVFVLFCFVF